MKRTCPSHIHDADSNAILEVNTVLLDCTELKIHGNCYNENENMKYEKTQFQWYD